jgi:hypothetical protein
MPYKQAMIYDRSNVSIAQTCSYPLDSDQKNSGEKETGGEEEWQYPRPKKSNEERKRKK